MTSVERVKVLLVDADAEVRKDVKRTLAQVGCDVITRDEGRGIGDDAAFLKPDLVLIGERVSGMSGREAAMILRARGQTFSAAIIALSDDASVASALSWLKAGATDVWYRASDAPLVNRLHALQREMSFTPVHLSSARGRLIAFARREALTGSVVAYKGTPFEGRVSFVQGAVEDASFGGATGDAAMDALLELDVAHLSWSSGEPQPAPAKPNWAESAFKPRVLVVEDDDALRVLSTKQLQAAGYRVESAIDGGSGLSKARGTSWDAIVLDLNLPVLDGWGVLRELKLNPATREAPILVMSAHDELREALKAAKAGARAYLKKSGKAKFLHDTVELLVTPRLKAYQALESLREATVDVGGVGPMWLLRTMAELDWRGRLELVDTFGKFTIEIALGQLMSAVMERGEIRVEGNAALEVFFDSRGEGKLLPSELTPNSKAPWLFDAVERTCEAMADSARQHMDDLLTRLSTLAIFDELAALYSKVASTTDLRVLSEVRTTSQSVRSLAEKLQLPVFEVEQSLAEMYRRGVIGLPPVHDVEDEPA